MLDNIFILYLHYPDQVKEVFQLANYFFIIIITILSKFLINVWVLPNSTSLEQFTNLNNLFIQSFSTQY